MKKHIKLLVLIFLFGITTNQCIAQTTTETHKDSINNILNKYYDLNLKMFQAGSTVSDIDNAFNLFTDDFTYVHAKFDGLYTKESLYKSALRNQKNGSYNGSVTDIKINNKIIGLNGATVQKRFVEKNNGSIVESELQMTLFEFKDGKISRIVEYW